MTLLEHVTIDSMPVFLEGNAMSLKMLVTSMSSGLDLATAHTAPKLFNLKAKLGKGMVIKILCAVLKSFCDSIKASKTMDAIDIVECAELLEERYSHDSIKDIILALKMAKLKGTKFYNAVDVSVIMGICEEYFESKIIWMENQHEVLKSKHSDSNTEADTIVSAMRVAAEKKERDVSRQRHEAHLERIAQSDRIKLQVLENEINKEHNK